MMNSALLSTCAHYSKAIRQVPLIPTVFVVSRESFDPTIPRGQVVFFFQNSHIVQVLPARKDFFAFLLVLPA